MSFDQKTGEFKRPTNRFWDELIECRYREKPVVIKVVEYWPGFVDRDPDTAEVTEIDSIWKLGTIKWLTDKVDKGEVLYLKNEHVMVLTPNGEHYVLAGIAYK